MSNLPDKEFKVMIIRMFTELRRRMDEHSENSRVRNTQELELENIKVFSKS